jgi:hypothetical protein
MLFPLWPVRCDGIYLVVVIANKLISSLDIINNLKDCLLGISPASEY